MALRLKGFGVNQVGLGVTAQRKGVLTDLPKALLVVETLRVKVMFPDAEPNLGFMLLMGLVESNLKEPLPEALVLKGRPEIDPFDFQVVGTHGLRLGGTGV